MKVQGTFPLNAQILLVGEAPGEQEVQAGRPFVGASGWMLDSLLANVGLDRSKLAITNVFQVRPPKNDVNWFFRGKREAKGEIGPYESFGGKYLKPEWWPEPARLLEEVQAANPKVIVALGRSALWTLTGKSKITEWRGTIVKSHSGHDVVPTYHPSAILRDYSLRPVAISDLDKAKRHLAKPIHPQPKTVLIPESRADLDAMFQDLWAGRLVAVDVETESKQITSLSLSPAPDRSYAIPIWDKRQPGWSHWTLDTEVHLWYNLLLLFREKELVLHNGIYDLSYFNELGIIPWLTPQDTMFMHHASQPELRKALGFLASLYTDNMAWKQMRIKPDHAVDKGDE